MSHDDLASELLRGATSIARYAGKSVPATYHLLESGKLPAFKDGKEWCAWKKDMRRHYEDLGRKGVA
jgi:hypothetical protein